VLISKILASPIKTLSSTRTGTNTGTGTFAFTLSTSNKTTCYSPSTPTLDLPSSCLASSSLKTSSFLPLTAFRITSKTITAVLLSSLSSSYASQDDVWIPSFLSGIAVLLSTPADAVLDDSAIVWITDSGIQYLLPTRGVNVSPSSFAKSGVSVLPPGKGAEWDSLKPGPYAISFGPGGVAIREVYALHRDQFEAFLFGVTPVLGSGAYEAVDVFVPGYQDAWIPVPSRLRWLGDERPLAGLRVGLKDIYDLEG